jgi:hypothetical protein
MNDPQQVDPRQSAAVDQSAEVRDPADDSGLLDDPTAIVETYPEAFDEKIDNAIHAIDAEARSGHSPLESNRSTDNRRDRQI